MIKNIIRVPLNKKCLFFEKSISNPLYSMNNFFGALLLCLISTVSFSQIENKKSEPNSNMESEKTTDKPAGYPVFEDTGNPVEDQKKYD